MTTIACNRKMMAGDSLSSAAGTRFKATKVHRVGDEIVGFAGGLDEGMAFIQWYQDQSKDKPKLEDFAALVLSETGITYYESLLVPIPVQERFAAIGSGADCALAAMHLGADPKKAVQVACKVRHDSGLPVKVLEMG